MMTDDGGGNDDGVIDGRVNGVVISDRCRQASQRTLPLARYSAALRKPDRQVPTFHHVDFTTADL